VRVYLSTLGCRLNEAEIQTWGMKFSACGHALVVCAADADLMVLNTCAVTAEAVRKSRKSIQRLQRENPTAKLAVSGCYVSLDEAASHTAGIDLVVTNQDKDEMVRRCIDTFCPDVMPNAATTPAASALFQRSRQRAFIKIQDGCRYRCTFCIVTVARGQERSRATQDIIAEVNQLHAAGIQEVVLTGVHVGGYGSDLNTDLHALVRQVLADTDIPRVRFASVEPWDLPEHFFYLFENPRLMPHMHLPLQSGSDSVLRRMARRCKSGDFASLLSAIRRQLPNFNVTTDIIVGFPGETDAEWQQTLEFVTTMDFGHIHIFSYSVRPGTRAAGLTGQVHGASKRQRSRELHTLARTSRLRVLHQQLHSNSDILWEAGKARADGWRHTGYTENYLRVQTDVPLGQSLHNTITRSHLAAIDTGSAQLIAAQHKIVSPPNPPVGADAVADSRLRSEPDNRPRAPVLSGIPVITLTD